MSYGVSLRLDDVSAMVLKMPAEPPDSVRSWRYFFIQVTSLTSKLMVSFQVSTRLEYF
jgi:hypothetical protein